MTPDAVKHFIEGDLVRIAATNLTLRSFTGSAGAARHPVAGEEGEVTKLDPAVGPTSITVERIENGQLVWRAEFTPDELDRVTA